MVGAQPAVGFYSPQEDLPGPWMDLLKEQHGGPAVYNGLFTACPQGRNWVLCNAKEATLTIDTTVELGAAEWARRLDAALQALQTRGALPTDVLLLAQEPSSIVTCGQVLVGLKSLLRTLKVVGCPTLHRNFLINTITTFRQLTSLTVVDAFCVLPGRSSLPSLTHVDFRCKGRMPEDCVAAIAVHLPWLKSLRLPWVLNQHWRSLFRSSNAPTTPTPTITNPTPTIPTNPTVTTNPYPTTNPTRNPHATTPHTLTHLTTTGTVKDQLVALLLEHAPALTRWTVHARGDGVYPFDFDDELDWSDKQWGLQVLRVESDEYFCIDELLCLPRGRDGPVALEVAEGGSLDVIFRSWGVPDDWLEGLSHWRVVSGRVRVSGDGSIEPDEDAEALCTAIPELGTLQMTTDVVIDLSTWDWTPEAVRLFSEAYPNHKFEVATWTLTDEQLTTIMRFGPNLRKVSVDAEFALQSDHSHMAWPWPEAGLHVNSVVRVHVGQVMKLPRMPPGSLHIDQFVLTSKAIKKVGVERATEWARSTLASNEHWSVTIECDKKHTADSKQCAKLLADMLTVLRAVPWDSTAPDARASVYLQRWPMTRPVMQALQGLPEWSRLDFGWDFSAKMWPLAYKEYRQLATYVPRSYTDWDIHVSKESPLYTHICTGRTAGGTD